MSNQVGPTVGQAVHMGADNGGRCAAVLTNSSARDAVLGKTYTQTTYLITKCLSGPPVLTGTKFLEFKLHSLHVILIRIGC
jgi:hypothetical protein